jgi:2-desacetyl-2-hydroxyethyl bacteriochlorophyllide A dehydrogenase
MLQIVLQEPGRFIRAESDPPKPGTAEALVRVHRVGVCGTDLHAFAGRQPFFSFPRILGHELGVEVLEAPPNDRGIRAGDRCAVEPYLNCGQCHACKLGKPNCCERLQVLGVHTDGGMRTLLAVPVERLYKSERLALDQLALVETLGIGAHAVSRGSVTRGEEVLVVGAGPIGLAVLQFALAAGGRVRVLEISPARREFAARFGVETLAEPDDRLADVVFDATGNAAAMSQSLAQVAYGGRLVFAGLVQGSISLDDPLFHRRELTLFASRNSANDFPGIITMIENGAIDTTTWITHRMPLAEVPSQFSRLTQQKNCVKAMIEVNEAP